MIMAQSASVLDAEELKQMCCLWMIDLDPRKHQPVRQGFPCYFLF